MSVPHPDELVYEDDELLVLEAIAAIKWAAANGAGQMMGMKRIPIPILMTGSARMGRLASVSFSGVKVK